MTLSVSASDVAVAEQALTPAAEVRASRIVRMKDGRVVDDGVTATS